MIGSPIKGGIDTDLRNDEMMIWKAKARMIVNGPAAVGEFVVTNKRLVFIAESEHTYFWKSSKTIFWDLALDRILDVDILEMNGVEHPMVRIHYNGDDNYFTFPEGEPEPVLAALRLFINSGRRIEKEMEMMRGVARSLKDESLHTHGKMPELIRDLPLPADQICFQCGKNLEEPTILDPEDTSSCAVCQD